MDIKIGNFVECEASGYCYEVHRIAGNNVLLRTVVPFTGFSRIVPRHQIGHTRYGELVIRAMQPDAHHRRPIKRA